MKQIHIPFIENLNEADIEAAGDLLEELGQNESIEILNWSNQYAYRPITFFKIGRSNDSIFIKYYVRGSMLRAVYSNDQDPVHNDSCVEFFCMTEGAQSYTNFEFNCIGTCSAARRKSRKEDVKPFSSQEMLTIKRFPSIGRKAFNEMEGMFEWELTVQIPFDLIGIDSKQLPVKIRGNFYKCADDSNSPHYVTWNPVSTENPDFHRPEYFGDLYFN